MNNDWELEQDTTALYQQLTMEDVHNRMMAVGDLIRISRVLPEGFGNDDWEADIPYLVEHSPLGASLDDIVRGAMAKLLNINHLPIDMIRGRFEFYINNPCLDIIEQQGVWEQDHFSLDQWNLLLSQGLVGSHCMEWLIKTQPSVIINQISLQSAKAIGEQFPTHTELMTGIEKTLDLVDLDNGMSCIEYLTALVKSGYKVASMDELTLRTPMIFSIIEELVRDADGKPNVNNIGYLNRTPNLFFETQDGEEDNTFIVCANVFGLVFNV